MLKKGTSGKKVEFIRKPSRQNTESFIDNWVSAEKKVQVPVNNLKRTTIYIPEDLRREVKLIALKEGITMTEVIIEAIKKHLC